ncbi:hypothetical protein ACFYMI_35265 [Streptomyces collinus]|uniref:hypothetical protein n=1 Tax=Streptomyces collinus TaxID=42684 RepID=UPI0036763EA3
MPAALARELMAQDLAAEQAPEASRLLRIGSARPLSPSSTRSRGWQIRGKRKTASSQEPE